MNCIFCPICGEKSFVQETTKKYDDGNISILKAVYVWDTIVDDKDGNIKNYEMDIEDSGVSMNRCDCPKGHYFYVTNDMLWLDLNIIE